MAERGILFSGALIGPLLSGTKTVTRRLVNLKDKGRCAADCDGPEPERAFPNHGLGPNGAGYISVPCKDGASQRVLCPHGAPGDVLWVRETFATDQDGHVAPAKGDVIIYRADGERPVETRWRPSLFMPRFASRITLQIDDVRVERLQDITQEDALREGVQGRHSFAAKWDELHGAGAWDQNDWVWRIAFHRVDQAQRKAAR